MLAFSYVRLLLRVKPRNRILGFSKTQSYYTNALEPFHPIAGKMPVRVTGEEAVTVIKSGAQSRLYLHELMTRKSRFRF